MEQLHRTRELVAPTWPPAPLVSSQSFEPRGRRGVWFEDAPWPAKPSLEYVRLLVTVGLLLLALPWLSRKLVTSPGDVLQAAGHRAMGKAVS
jgi:hypothetical protein